MKKFIEKNLNKFNIGLIVLIAIAPLLLCFNSNLWFDEAYSVGLVRQPWENLFISAINDVHPILYYVLLKLYSLIFGNSVIALRIFSVIPVVILAIFSFVKIRKEFGDRVSFYFNLLLLILPVTMHYGSQIRMYSLAMLFVVITAVYAYLAYKNNKKKDWVIFAIASICSAYTHYFALFTIGIINILLLFFIIKEKKELKKRWFIYAVIQIILYIPGILIFLLQATRVAGGFWISVNYPDIITQIIEFFFLDSINSGLPSIFGLFIVIYMILRVHKLYLEDRKKIRPVTIALTTAGLVILVTLLISFVRAVFIPRYMLPMLGLFIFAFAYVLSIEKSRLIKIIICAGLISLTIWNGITLWNKSYSAENKVPIDAVKSEIQPNDIFVYTTVGPSSTMALEFKDNQQYFYNKDNWTVEKAYGAFAPQMKIINTLEEIENYTGRIWVIDDGNTNMYDYINEMEGTTLIKEQENYYHPFSGDTFKIALFQKD